MLETMSEHYTHAPSSSQNPVIIAVDKVYFLYNENVVLDNITFDVHQGDYLGVLGPNGGGKTTLLKIIVGLLKPTRGSVNLFNKPIKEFRDWHHIGYVPQRVQQGEWQFPATVEEIVNSGRTGRKRFVEHFTDEDSATVQTAMKVAEVGKLRNRLLSSLSGGQRQRVFIARALAAQPKLLILDEPTVGVDIATQQQFYAFLKELRATYNVTIILVTHDIDVIASEVEYILCVNRELVCHSPLKDVINQETLDKLYGKKIKYIFHGHN